MYQQFMKTYPYLFIIMGALFFFTSNGCRTGVERDMDRFRKQLAGTWEVKSIEYISTGTVITYSNNPPLIIWENCDFEVNVSAYCPGEIRDQEGDLQPILYQGTLERNRDKDGNVQIVDANDAIDLPSDYQLPGTSAQFNDSLRFISDFSFEIKEDSLILKDGIIAGDSVFIENVEIITIRRE